jgi:hypothetical protein
VGLTVSERDGIERGLASVAPGRGFDQFNFGLKLGSETLPYLGYALDVGLAHQGISKVTPYERQQSSLRSLKFQRTRRRGC